MFDKKYILEGKEDHKSNYLKVKKEACKMIDYLI